MRIIIPMLMFATACAKGPSAEAPEAPEIPRIDSRGLTRWVDSQYNVVCYAFSFDTLKCFPISDEGTVQYSLDFQNQAD